MPMILQLMRTSPPNSVSGGAAVAKLGTRNPQETSKNVAQVSDERPDDRGRGWWIKGGTIMVECRKLLKDKFPVLGGSVMPPG
jgi:hypothetical protein